MLDAGVAGKLLDLVSRGEVMNCAHNGCRCNDATIERDGKNYCSERCADATLQGPASAKGCLCGHPDCAAV
jgi:hypothetical protein